MSHRFPIDPVVPTRVRSDLDLSQEGAEDLFRRSVGSEEEVVSPSPRPLPARPFTPPRAASNHGRFLTALVLVVTGASAAGLLAGLALVAGTAAGMVALQS